MKMNSYPKTVEYKKYDDCFEPKVLKIFTASFENYPLFYGIFKNGFKEEKSFLNSMNA